MKTRKSITTRARLRFPAWQGVYEATLQETDIETLFKLVELAEATILTRRDTLNGTSRHRAERQAIEGALQVLTVIKQARLHFLRHPGGAIAKG